MHDRALVLYAFVRRGTIEFVVNETDGEPSRIRQAEAARREARDWLEREGAWAAVTDVERRLFEAPSGSWPREAVADAMWRKESLGTLLWALEHLDEMPAYGLEFEQQRLDEAITRYGSVDGVPCRRSAAPRRPDRGGVARGRRLARRHRGPRGGRRAGGLGGGRTLPGAQLAPRSRRRTSVTTPHTSSAITPSGIR